jgi:hypothetical protein
MHITPANPFAIDRRAFMSHSAGGIGLLALNQLLDSHANADRPSRNAGDALSVRAPHHPPKAKSVILLYQNGGPSQMDLFDHKPELTKQNGKPYPGKVEAHFHKQVGKVLSAPFAFRRNGQCGMELSELLPHTGGIADEITLIRSMTTDSVDHERALRLIHSGSSVIPKASWGSWVVYGLGTERNDLPAYVVLTDPAGLPIDRANNWSSGFLPAVYQGTTFRSTGMPVLHLDRPEDVSNVARRNQLKLLEQLNTSHGKQHPGNSDLQARIRNFELAARMQTSVPSALDISQETKETQSLYGLDSPATADYGRRCLIARRLVEEGVRFVSLYLNSQPWDTHSKNAENLKKLCGRMDRPSAALVIDLKRRGLLDDTIVMWAGEFGRLPVAQGTDGRDHNRHAFSLWLAGGGFRKGYVHGKTDDFAYKAVENVVNVHDLHATLLHALGLDHELLTYPNEGRDETLTDVLVTGANVVDDLLT